MRQFRRDVSIDLFDYDASIVIAKAMRIYVASVLQDGRAEREELQQEEVPATGW